MEDSLSATLGGTRDWGSPSPKMAPDTESSGLLFFPSQSKQSSSYSDRDTTEEESESLDDMDFLTRQKKLQAEAKMALAMAKPMAKMQVEVEKQNRKKSPVADLVSRRHWNASECLVAKMVDAVPVLSQSYANLGFYKAVCKKYCHWEIFKFVSFSFLLKDS